MSSKSSPPSLTTWQLVKMAAPIVFTSIFLPAVDNVTDLRLIFRLYTGVKSCVNSKDLPWQDSYTCQEDISSYCQSNPNSFVCDDFERYVSVLPGCKRIWQNEHTCQEDPATYCQKNPNSNGCSYFERSGYVRDIPGCVFISCRSDAATFCELKPTSPICGHFKHPRFATMFLGEIFILPKSFMKTKFQFPIC